MECKKPYKSTQHPVYRLGLLLALVMLGRASPAYALFCGAYVVSDGASKLEVLHKCGDPTLAEQRVEYTTVYVSPGGHRVPAQRESPRTGSPSFPGSGRGLQSPNPQPVVRNRTLSPQPAPGAFVPVIPLQPVVIAELVEEWTYNFGPHRLMYRLRFADGVLRSITTLTYGY